MKLSISTQNKDQVVDITEEVEKILEKQEKESGLCNIFVQHTTCAITTADLDPGTDEDFLDFLRGIEPDISYNHPHDPNHAPDHFHSSVIGPSVVIPFANQQLLLGTWQRVVLVELDGPRERHVVVTII